MFKKLIIMRSLKKLSIQSFPWKRKSILLLVSLDFHSKAGIRMTK